MAAQTAAASGPTTRCCTRARRYDGGIRSFRIDAVKAQLHWHSKPSKVRLPG
jgi:hypothetical protein